MPATGRPSSRRCPRLRIFARQVWHCRPRRPPLVRQRRGHVASLLPGKSPTDMGGLLVAVEVDSGPSDQSGGIFSDAALGAGILKLHGSIVAH